MFYRRGENRIKNPYNLSDMYVRYKEDHQDNPLYDVEKQLFYDICSEFYKEVVDQIIFKDKEFKIPFSVGEIYIRKYAPELEEIKTRTSFIDWKNTAALGKIVYHLNEHSNGFKFVIKWRKVRNQIRYVDIYKFVPTRTFKRTLAMAIKTRTSDYTEKK